MRELDGVIKAVIIQGAVWTIVILIAHFSNNIILGVIFVIGCIVADTYLVVRKGFHVVIYLMSFIWMGTMVILLQDIQLRH